MISSSKPGRPKYPSPLLNSTSDFPSNIPVINDYPLAEGKHFI